MGKANRTTFNKMQKERARQQKARDKAEKKRNKAEAKDEQAANPDALDTSSPESPSDIIPTGPFSNIP